MTLRARWDRRDWLFLGGLLLFTVAIWSRVIFSRDYSFGVELDFLRQFYPARFFAAKSLAGGCFPLWNPHLLCGQPFFASYQTAMLYPFNLMMVGLYGAAGADLPLRAQCGFVVFHFFMAGVFTYLLGRDLCMGRVGAAVASVTYMLSGYMLAHSGHMNQQSAAAWIPLIFLLFKRCLDRKKMSYALAAGACLGVALLAGHLQPLFYLCLLLLCLVVHSALSVRGDPRKAGPGFGLAALASTVAVGGALAAVQLLPTYQMIGLSSRRNMSYGLAATYSLPRRQLITLIFPHFYGTSPAGYVGGWAPAMWEMYGYSGIVGGALGVVALLRRRKSLVVFLWAVALLSIVLALGPGGYIWTALFKSHLLFDRFRDPARVLVVFGFATALLAGLGADHLSRLVSTASERLRYRDAVRVVALLLAGLLVLVLVISLFLILRGPGRADHTRIALRSMLLPSLLLAALFVLLLLSRRDGRRARLSLAAGLLVLVAVDLAVQGVPWTMVRVNPDDLFGDARASRYVAAREGEFRVETDAHTMYPALDDGSLYGLEKASGDDSLVLMDYHRYRELVVPSVSPGVQPGLFYEGGLRSPLLDLMNVVYFMTRKKIPGRLAEGKFRYLRSLDGVRVYRNDAALPRVRMTDAVVVSDSGEAFRVLERTKGEGLAAEAVVVAGKGMKAGGRIESGGGRVHVVRRTPNRAVIRVDGSASGLLVLADVYYPGWEVYVDGRRKEVLRVNFLFRGVLLEGGQRKVVFHFRPASLRAGAAVSSATLALLVIYGMALVATERKKAKEARV